MRRGKIHQSTKRSLASLKADYRNVKADFDGFLERVDNLEELRGFIEENIRITEESLDIDRANVTTIRDTLKSIGYDRQRMEIRLNHLWEDIKAFEEEE